MPTCRPFSKLKKEIENLFVSDLNMEFCCTAFPIRGQWESYNSIPRFYVRLNKEIIWDFPKDFEVKDINYGYWASNNHISELVRDYIDTGAAQLLTKEFENEKWTFTIDNYSTKQQRSISIHYKLTELFIAADRRLGKQKLIEWARHIDNPKVDEILKERFSK